MPAPSRPSASDSVADDVVLWAIGGIGLGAAAVWGGAQLATLLRHGQSLPVGLGTSTTSTTSTTAPDTTTTSTTSASTTTSTTVSTTTPGNTTTTHTRLR